MACNCNKPCSKCSPEPCNCHPCYGTLIGDCKTPCNGTTATPIDTCLTNEYCTDGCEEFLEAKCIMFSDGKTLEDKITEIFTLLECVCNPSTNCSNVGTPTDSGNICI